MEVQLLDLTRSTIALGIFIGMKHALPLHEKQFWPPTDNQEENDNA